MSKTNRDCYPTINLRIGKTSWDDDEWREKGRIVTADFDTGATDLWLSEELLGDFGLSRGILNFYRDARMFDQNFRFYTSKLKVALIGASGESEVKEVPCHVVEDFANSPFTQLNADRKALAGRTLLQWFNATVEFDAPRNETHILLQDWQGFEMEVANLYRALDVSVRRNINLAGNQVDVFLEERTSSGKVLRSIVECKFYRKPVGIQQVRDLVSVFEFARSAGLAEHAVLVASKGFTKDAHLVAENIGIELLEVEDLRARVASKGGGSRGLSGGGAAAATKLKPADTLHRQKKAFVIMPFSDEFKDTYMLGIREPLATQGYVCVRADEIEFSGRIMDKILDLIRDSEIIVAEVTQHNANVYYELGIAHAMGKTVVLCTKDISRAPFDVRDLNHIVYNSIVDLRKKLSRRLESLIQIADL